MPVSTIAPRRANFFDKSLELRNYSAAALAATASETTIALVAVAHLDFKAVVNAAAHSGYAAGTAQWTITIEASTASNGTFVTVGTVVLDGTQKEYDIPLSGDWIEEKAPGALFIRATATKTGAPGNLTYGAYLSNPPDYC